MGTEAYLENPPWVDRVLNKNFDSIRRRFGEEFLPIPSTSSSKKKHFEELGCGHYGCVLNTVTPGVIIKVTSDPTEAAFVTASQQIGELPEGIVRYLGVFQVQDEHRGRPIYVLWREEASNVGGLLSERQFSDFRRVINRLDAFKIYASYARDTIKRSSSASKLLTDSMRLEEWASDAVNYERVTHLGSRFDYVAYKHEVPSHFKGAYRVAYAVQACKWIAQEMENEDIGYLVGGALGFYLEQGILLADVHANNVGQVARPDEYTKPIWVITDPGHMVALDPKWFDLRVPVL